MLRIGMAKVAARGEFTKIRRTLAATVIALTAMGASNANAAISFVGSWQVDQGPNWPSVPTAFSGIDAAAFLFGGSASNYFISTIDNNPANINYSAWISTWGGACSGAFPCGTVVAQDYVISTLGLYENPGDTSAYVHDWAEGAQYTNYAFVSTVPEPSTWAMLIMGFGVVGFSLRRRRKTALI